MAIILQPSGDDHLPIEAIVLAGSRPAFLIKDGSFQIDINSAWASLEAHRPVLERAIRSVGRLESDGGVFPFAGTAFLVDRKFAVTANFVAEALGRQPSGSEGGDAPDKLQGVWLNLKAEIGSAEAERIAVRKMHFVHPYWGFSFVELAEEVDPNRVSPLPIATAPDENLEGRTVCIIGYPSLDFREARDGLNLVFRNVFDVKRLMPGKIMGTSRFGRENSLVLTHDATTTGGTSGAPLIDLETGTVIGIHVGGRSLHANYAFPAWEIGRDPQWARFSKTAAMEALPDVAITRRNSIGGTLSEEPIFSFDYVSGLHRRLMKFGMAEDDKIKVLLAGIPKEYVATLSSVKSPAERLMLILHAVNETIIKLQGHLPFYYLLTNSRDMRIWDKVWVKEVEAMLAALRERESLLT